MIDWDAEVRQIAIAYPAGMSAVVQLLGPVPSPTPDVSEADQRDALDTLARVAQKLETAALS